LIKKINRKKHKALEEQYDHYVCEFCMEIGAKEVISEFVEKLDKLELDSVGYSHHLQNRIIELKLEYLKRLPNATGEG